MSSTDTIRHLDSRRPPAPALEWRWLWPLARQYRSSLALIFLLSAGMAGLTALAPWPLKYVIDGVLPAVVPQASALGGGYGLPAWLDVGTLIALAAVAYVLVRATQRALAWIRAMLIALVGVRLVNAVRSDIFARAQSADIAAVERRRTGDLGKVLAADVSGGRELMQQVLVPALTACLTVVILLVVIVQVNPVFAALALGVGGLYLLLVRFSAPRMMARSFDYQNAEGMIAADAERTLAFLPLTRAYATEQREAHRFRRATDGALDTYLRSVRLDTLFGQAVGAVTTLGTAATLLLGCVFVLEGELTIGLLVVLINYVTQLYAPLETLAYTSSTATAAFGKLKRVAAVRGLPPEGGDVGTVRATSSTASAPALHMEGVRFGYRDDAPLLEGVDLELHDGELVVIRGPNGAGKSSILSLLLRLYEPWSGTVNVAGHSAASLELASYRARFSYASQDSVIVDGTLRDNLLLGAGEVDDATILRRARDVALDTFVDGLPDGLDMPMTADFPGLSGGQRQRVGLLRALLRTADILLLDEPTSALDPDSEARVWTTLREESRRRPVLVISHSSAAIPFADRIYELDDRRFVVIPAEKGGP